MGEDVPVGAAVVGGGHRPQVVAAFRGGDRRAGELAVGHGDAVPGHRLVHDPHVVAADLVAEAAGAAVDHDAHLAVAQPELLRRGGVVDLLDRLDLQEVVARAEATHLVQAPVDGPGADLIGIGVGDGALILAAQQVAFDAVALLHRPRPGPGSAHGRLHDPRHPHLPPLRDPEPVRALLDKFHLQPRPYPP